MGKTDIAQQKLEILMRNNDRMKELIESYSGQTLSTEANKISQTIDAIASESDELNRTLNSVITRMKGEIAMEDSSIEELDPDSKEAKKASPEYRMKRTIFGTYVGRFQAVLSQSNELQIDYKKAVQTSIKKQLRISNPKLTEEELDVQVSDPEKGRLLLSQQILGVHEKVKAVLSDVMDKHKEIEKLETTIMQTHKLWLMLSELVQEQTEHLGNIEFSMKDARNHVEKGEKNVVQAKKWYQETRKVNLRVFVQKSATNHNSLENVLYIGSAWSNRIGNRTLLLPEEIRSLISPFLVPEFMYEIKMS